MKIVKIMRRIPFVVLLTLTNLVFAQKAPVQVSGGYLVEIKTSAICKMCKEAIEYELTFTKGVKDANLDLENKVVSVTYNPKRVTPEELRQHVAGVGYHADNVKRDSVAYENLPFCCKDGAEKLHGDHEKH